MMEHARKSVRMKDFDYSQAGAYFVTICTQNKECLFGEIVKGEMVLNDAGRIVQTTWDELPTRYTNVTLDTYAIMPNHFHGIIILNPEPVGARSSRPNNDGRENRAPTLGKIIAYFKYQTTKQINMARNTGTQKLWQRNYYEHVIRNDSDLNQIREYISQNALKWELDEENPQNK
jgi:putative transposase